MKKLLKVLAPVVAIPYAIGIIALSLFLMASACMAMILDKVAAQTMPKLAFIKKRTAVVSIRAEVFSERKLSA
jgi:hypothetical protein